MEGLGLNPDSEALASELILVSSMLCVATSQERGQINNDMF